MCSNPLAQPDASSSDALGRDSLQTTVFFKNLKTQKGTASLMECLICPECQTINHLGWLFCPQCGKQVDASFLQTMEPADQAPTMVASMSPPQSPLQTVVAGKQSTAVQRPAETVADAPSFPQQSAQVPRQSQPQRSAERSPQPQQPAILDLPRQQPTEQPSVSANSSTGPPDREPNASAPAIQHTTVACAECGSDNNSDYSFCLNCGASLPVTKTIVMASIAHPVKPRLRLLVQGGGSGPTYEIKNEARIGRTEGSITFPHDSLMSSNHARVLKSGADFMLIDEASSNGTFIRVKRETKLEPGDVILVGGQLFRFEA